MKLTYKSITDKKVAIKLNGKLVTRLGGLTLMLGSPTIALKISFASSITLILYQICYTYIS